MATKITDAQIRTLRAEAATAGDTGEACAKAIAAAASAVEYEEYSAGWRIHTVGSSGVADGYWSQKLYKSRKAAQRDAARDARAASIQLIVLPAR